MVRSRRAQELRWGLYLDESGDFASDDRVAVAGVLVPLDHPEMSAVRLEERLRAAARNFPWPFKASELNRPVLFALAAAGASALPAELQDALDELERTQKEPFERVRRSLAAGERPDYADVVCLDQECRRIQPVAYSRLSLMAATSRGRVVRCLAQLADVCAESGAGAVLVACGETDAPVGSDDTSRYLQLLRWVLQRAADLLSLREGPHRVEVTVLERDVADTIAGQMLRTRLHMRHVNPLVEEVNDRARGPVKMLAAAVRPYDQTMHAVLVLADLVANRARHALRRSGALASVEASLGKSLRCPVRSGNPPLSHLAAAGRAQEEIERARRGETAPAEPWPQDARVWAMEQAQEWIGVFQSWTCAKH